MKTTFLSTHTRDESLPWFPCKSRKSYIPVSG